TPAPATPVPVLTTALNADAPAPATPAPAASPTTLNPSNLDALNAARLSRGLNSAVNQQGGNVTLRLTPPDLGTVRIELNLQGTSVSARFHAETESARTLLTQQLTQLRSTLEAQGLQVDRLGVQALSSSANASSLQNQTQQDPSASSQNPNEGRSRGQNSGQSPQDRDPSSSDRPAPERFNDLFRPDDDPADLN
ncbi:MAG: flagellar hook-length control protein FliK, partial [Planctomycetota bacterium]